MGYLSFYSYLASTVAYTVLFLVLALNKNNNIVAGPFQLTALFSILWSAYSSYAVLDEDIYIFETLGMETLRNGAWFYFLSVLF